LTKKNNEIPVESFCESNAWKTQSDQKKRHVWEYLKGYAALFQEQEFKNKWGRINNEQWSKLEKQQKFDYFWPHAIWLKITLIPNSTKGKRLCFYLGNQVRENLLFMRQ